MFTLYVIAATDWFKLRTQGSEDAQSTLWSACSPDDSSIEVGAIARQCCRERAGVGKLYKRTGNARSLLSAHSNIFDFSCLLDN